MKTINLRDYYPFYHNDLFIEVNPIPVKYAMNVLGWNAGGCRLPLVDPSEAHQKLIEETLNVAGLLQK